MEFLKWLVGPPTECLRCRKRISRSEDWAAVITYPGARQGALCEICSIRLKGSRAQYLFLKISDPDDFKQILLKMETVTDDGKLVVAKDYDEEWGEWISTVSGQLPEFTVSELSKKLYQFWLTPRVNILRVRSATEIWMAEKIEAFLKLYYKLYYIQSTRTWFEECTITVVRTGAETFKADGTLNTPRGLFRLKEFPITRL